MNRIAIASLPLALAGPALAQSAAKKTGDFIQEAATSDMFEIESSKLALDRADVATKTFAQQMIADHQKTTGEPKGLVTSGKVQATLPAAMTSSQQSMLDKLKGLKGDDVIKQYHSDQQSAHKDAVDLFKRYGDGGDNACLKASATPTHPALLHHLQMATDLNK
jgi:putative membrane protein